MEMTNTAALLTLLILSGTLRVAALECDRIRDASPGGLVLYLGKTVPDQENAECVVFAINRLGEQRYERAIPILAKLLDFPWPPNARQKQKLFVIEHDGGSIYPAATALQKIGKKSLPSVLEVMKSRSASRTAQEVAISVWMGIYKSEVPKGVALLKQESDRTKDPATRQRLGWAAYKAIGWCGLSDKAQCQAAVNTRYSN